jgi:hypothetical protein
MKHVLSLLALCIAAASAVQAAVPLRDPRISGTGSQIASGTFTVQSGATFALASGAIFTAANPISLAAGGTGVALTDPGASRLLGWDDSAGAVVWFNLGGGLAIDATTLKSNQLTATGVLNFPSIAASGGHQDLTISVSGATVGNAVALGLPDAPAAGIVFNAYVSAADTVTVRATNATAGAIDPASATYRVVVFLY